MPFKQDELSFLRIRTKQYEMMISPSESELGCSNAAGPRAGILTVCLLPVLAVYYRREVSTSGTTRSYHHTLKGSLRLSYWRSAKSREAMSSVGDESVKNWNDIPSGDEQLKSLL